MRGKFPCRLLHLLAHWLHTCDWKLQHLSSKQRAEILFFPTSPRIQRKQVHTPLATMASPDPTSQRMVMRSHSRTALESDPDPDPDHLDLAALGHTANAPLHCSNKRSSSSRDSISLDAFNSQLQFAELAII